jgi:peptidoglycan/xylan/chitin deacetylase (PgdA/CDA1 family)
VTFDDGYLDNLETASPILTELGIPATFFVCTERLDEEHEPWWDVVERVLIADRATPETLNIQTGAQVLELPTRSLEERRHALFSAHAILLEAGTAARDSVLEQLVDWGGEADLPHHARRVMISGELRDLSARPGHELGAHTVHHLMLTSHPTEVRRSELLQSKLVLEEVMNRSATAVAYPYGAADFATTSVAEEVGFNMGWSVDADVVTARSDPFRLPRLDFSQLGERTFADALTRVFSE